MGQIGKITSSSNQQIKYINNLQTKASVRRKEGVFVVEGLKIFLEVPDELIVNIYVSESTIKDITETKKGFNDSIYEKVRKKLNNHDFTVISDDIAKNISDTVTDQGMFVVVKQLEYDIDDYINIEEKQIFVILDGLNDPGNMGTIIRTAEGAGVSMILTNKECVDIYNPKVTRATMGSLFRVPVKNCQNLVETIKYLKSKGIVMYGAHLNGKEYFADDALNESVCIFIGNEARGLSEEISNEADKLIRIPMMGKLESLNASVAAGILMYEARRKISKWQKVYT